MATRIDSFMMQTLDRVPARDVIEVLHEDSVPRWLHTRWELTQRAGLQSVRVRSNSYPVTMRIYVDGEAAASTIVSIPGPGEVRLAVAALHGAVDFDFDGQDSVVRYVRLVLQDVAEVPDLVYLRDAPSYRGYRFRLEEAGRPSVARVLTEDYTSVTLTLYADGAQVYSAAVTGDGPIVFPKTLTAARDWELDIATDAKIELVKLRVARDVPATAIVDLPRGGLEWAPWLYTDLLFSEEVRPGSVRVWSSSYPVTLRLYLDGAAAPSKTLTIADSAEARLEVARCSRLSWDMNGADDKVSRFQLYTRAEQIIGSGPLRLEGRGGWRNFRFRFEARNQFACGAVSASDYKDLVFRVLDEDGKTWFTQRVKGPEAFRMDLGADGEIFEVDIEAPAGTTIENVVLYPWTRRSVSGVVWAPVQDGTIPPWWYSWYEFQGAGGSGGKARLRSGIVAAENKPGTSSRLVNLDLYSEAGAHARVAVSDSAEFLLDSVFTCDALRFSFGDRDMQVREAWLFAEEVVPLEGAAFVVRNTGANTPWRNRMLEFKTSGSFGAGRAVAATYPVTLLLTSDSGTVTQVVADNKDFLLGAAANAREWHLSVAHHGDLREVHLFAREDVLFGNGLVVVKREGSVFSWLDKRFRSPRPVAPSCGRIIADAYPVTLTLRANGVQVASIAVADERGFRLPRVRAQRQWAFDAVGTDVIREVVLATSMERLKGEV